MRQVSDVTGKVYYDEDMVFFRNYIQAAAYLSYGAELIDLFTDSNMKLVFIFSRKDHEKYKNKWNQRNAQYHNAVGGHNEK